MQEFGRFDKIFRRQAASVDAGAANGPLFRHSNGFAHFLSRKNRSEGGRSGTKNQKIITKSRHDAPLKNLSFDSSLLDYFAEETE